MEINNLSPDEIKQMILLLQNMLPEKSNNVKKPRKKTQPKIKNKTINLNKFDEMKEYHLHKEDSEIDKKLSKFPLVPRTRKFQPVSVICIGCGKKEKVSSSILDSPERYKCNKCCSR